MITLGFLLALTLAPQQACDPSFTFDEIRFGDGNVTGANALADLDGDGHLDLVIVNGKMADPESAFAYVMLGNGDGTLQPRREFRIGPNPFSPHVADFNEDGHADVVTGFGVAGSNGGASLLLGNGDGTFSPERRFVSSHPLGRGAIGDVNRDGHVDFIVTSYIPDLVAVFLGDGLGTLNGPAFFRTDPGPQAIAIGDFDEDGRADLLVVNEIGNVSMLRGRGDGTFDDAKATRVGRWPFDLALADFDRDGHLDAAVVNDLDFAVQILRGSGDGTFRSSGVYPANGFPEGIVAADFNGDDVVDLAIGNSVEHFVSILANNGDGTFAAPHAFAAGFNAWMLATGDVDHDGDNDISVANAGGTSMLRNLTHPLHVPALLLPRAKRGEAYGPHSFAAEDGTGPYRYTLTGALPRGLFFDAERGVLAGNPDEAGVFRFTISVTDAQCTSSRTFTIAVDPLRTRAVRK